MVLPGGPPDAAHPRGIIAGALENGSLDLWDAEKLASGAADAFMSRTTKHTGAIKSLEFNPLKPQILATRRRQWRAVCLQRRGRAEPFPAWHRRRSL